MDLSEQFGRFLLAGAVAAAVDLYGYHWLNGRFPQLGRVWASVLSTTLAMTVSFLLNRHWVFPGGGFEAALLIRFVVVTLIAAYGIQSLVIHVLSRYCEDKSQGAADGRGGGAACENDVARQLDVYPVPSGGSPACSADRPDGTGQWPVLPSVNRRNGSRAARFSILDSLSSRHGGAAGRAWKARYDVLERNAVKAAALATALVWNFCWYRWYVFA